MSNSEIKKSLDETRNEFIIRCCSSREELGLTWVELANQLNRELAETHPSSYYCKKFSTYKRSNNTTDQLDDKILKIKKEKVKISDEVSQLRQYVRRLSREESIKDIALKFSKSMSKKNFLKLPQDIVYKPDKDFNGILLLSDWHYGMICDNSFNKFDPDICRRRVSDLLVDVLNRLKENNISKVTVLNLSDLIAGRIHTQIRIESRFDVITQTMEVSEILAEFLDALAQVCEVDYYDCLDNHSRLEPDKKESLDLESLVRIIPWYLRQRLSNNPCIHIKNNEFGPDIITCKVLKYNIAGVHGNNDRPTTVLDNLTLMTHRHYDLVCTAHLHHFSMDEQHQSLILSNGSLMGTDSNAFKLRLTSDPSQSFIVVTPRNVAEKVYRIQLN